MTDPIPPRCVVVMGVSGSGKSTMGRVLADRLGVPFVDGDDLHPAENIAKMAAGTPLDDDDRGPWLDTVARRIAAATGAGGGIVVACSALRRRYRDRITAIAPSTVFVHLVGGPELIARRQAARTHEFMPTTLLASQFASLEPLEADEPGFAVEVDRAPEQLVEAIADRLVD